MTALSAHAARAAAWIYTRLYATKRRADRGDISVTTVIIWVAGITGAALVAGTITVVVNKYNASLLDTLTGE